MSDARVEYILAHSDPLDVANAVQSTVESLSWETFYEVASQGRTRLAGSYREELNEVLALDPPYVREEFYNFLKRNPRALASFNSSFITRVASRLESSSPPLFGDARARDRRRVWAYAAAIAAAFVLGAAITAFVTHSRLPLQAASRTTPLRAAPMHLTKPAHKQQHAIAHPIRRRTDEVVSEETPQAQTPAPQQSVAPVVLQQMKPSPSAASPKPVPNGKGDAVVGIPQPSPTATPEENPIDAESGTPVWRRGTVNVQASPAAPPEVQSESVPHESKAIPVRTATPTPAKPKATQKPGLVKRVINVFKGQPAPSPSPSPSP